MRRAWCRALVVTSCGVHVGCGSVAGPAARPADRTAIVLNDNGAWSWFEDERAVVDPATGTLLVSSVASATGDGGLERAGDVDIVAYDLATGSSRRSVLHADLQADDHNSAAVHVRADGRYLAMYTGHASDRLSRWRVSQHPGDPSSWQPERRVRHGAPATYSNVYPGDGRRPGMLYAFVRSVGNDPTILVSDDDGSTWSRSGRLLQGPGRPYVRYADDAAGRIHLITTDQHPLDFPNSIYHGIVDQGRLLRSDGTTIDADLTDADAVAPAELTTVFAGDASRRGWTVDVEVDGRGRPYAVFSVHALSGPDRTSALQHAAGRHCYYFARFDGVEWSVHPMAHAGSALYPAEPSYTGLVALDPQDPRRVVISTDVDPTTGRPLVSAADQRRHHELFSGITHDGGAHWAWTPLTSSSTADNIRPVVPRWESDQIAVLWLHGTYTSYVDYDLDVLATITARSSTPGSGPAATTCRS